MLTALRPHLTFASHLSIYLLVVVVTSLVGGFLSAFAAAVAGSLLLNFYFAPPIHTFTIARGDNVTALVIFLLVGLLVSRVVDLVRAPVGACRAGQRRGRDDVDAGRQPAARRAGACPRC